MHQLINRRLKSEEESGYLFEIIREIRLDHPTMSCRAMYFKIKPKVIGRDKFESLCRSWGYTVVKPKNYRRTTNSYGVIRFENYLNDLIVNGINQAFVSDITFYALDKFYYITFIMDAYSRYIVGYSVSDNLTTEATTLPALQMALKYRKYKLPKGVILHSDGGGQFFDNEFLLLTQQYKFKNSMCEYAYENGKAERINGVIKNNYLVHREINTYKDLVREVDRSVSLYNTGKPHKELKYRIPLEIEKEQLNLHKQTKLTMTES